MEVALTELRVLSLTSFILFLVYLVVYYRNYSEGIRYISFGYGLYICSNLVIQYTVLDNNSLAYFLCYKLLYPFSLILIIFGAYSLVKKSFSIIYISICILVSSLTFLSLLTMNNFSIFIFLDHIVFGFFITKLGIDLINATLGKNLKTNYAGYVFILWGVVKICCTILLIRYQISKFWFLLDMVICFIALFGILITYLEYLIQKKNTNSLDSFKFRRIKSTNKKSLDKISNSNMKPDDIKLIAENPGDLFYRFKFVPYSGFDYLSKSVYDITGYTREEHYADPNLVFNTIHPDDLHYLMKKISGNLNFSRPIIQRWYRKNGSLVWLEEHCVPVYNSEGVLIAVEGICRDITERIELEKDIKDHNVFDPLTGIKNRVSFIRELENIQCQNYGIIIVSIDNVRSVNYKLGYEYGNKLILEALNIIKSVCPSSSIIGRINGNEFSIILAESTQNEIEALGWNILKTSIGYMGNRPEEVLKLSLGYGISKDEITPTEVFMEADKNMYRNKINKQC